MLADIREGKTDSLPEVHKWLKRSRSNSITIKRRRSKNGRANVDESWDIEQELGSQL